MSSQFTRISLVRHGSVEHAEIIYGRRKGYWLNPEGQQQARASALVLAKFPIHAIFSSPLLRSLQTAAAILEEHSMSSFEIREELTEVHSSFEGQPREIVEQRGYDLYTGQAPQFESPQDVAERMLGVLRTIAAKCQGKHIVAVTHGDPMAFTFLALLGEGLTPAHKNDLRAWGLPNRYPKYGSIVTLEIPTADNSLRIGYLHPSSNPSAQDLFLFAREASASVFAPPSLPEPQHNSTNSEREWGQKASRQPERTENHEWPIQNHRTT